MPPDNADTVAPGEDVDFPNNGGIGGDGIVRATASSFTLADIGAYLVQFVVSATQAGQLVLTLNGTELPYAVFGRASGASQIVGMAIITTTAAGSTLTVRNPEDNPAALAITPTAGGTQPTTAHLIITQLA